MWIGYAQDAPDFIVKLARSLNVEPVSFVATQFTNHDMKMLGDAAMGIAVGQASRVYRKVELERTGRELHDECGFEAVGAQFVQKFRIVLVVMH